jgi:DNA-binding transcriptional ArsR family regulator
MTLPTQTQINWELATAYDLFLSLEVLHHPEEFGLRAPWAAGVRSRVPGDMRKVLEDAPMLLRVPLHWLYSIPAPKDSTAALWSLRQIPVAERLPALALSMETSAALAEFLQEVAERRSWNEKDLELFREIYHSRKYYTQKHLSTILDWWSRPVEFGEIFLDALQAYYQEFFAEEERRIRPALLISIEQATEKAESLSLHELIEQLSQGVHLPIETEITQIVFSPSYWISPLIVFGKVSTGRMVLVYGARPADTSLVPGEAVPDALLRSLKALADPTRLRIMRYVSVEPMTVTQLSRKLRLRPPTVAHHMKQLRLAGLVHLSLETGGDKYTARTEMIEEVLSNFQDFLKEEKAE